MKSPSEMLQELKGLVESLEKDAEKSTRGMKAAGIRYRAAMQQIRDLAIAARKSVLEFRNETKSTKEEEVVEPNFMTIFEPAQPEPVAEPQFFNIFEVPQIEEEIEEVSEDMIIAETVEETEPEKVEENESISYWYSKFAY